jgi:hypothetical protein
LTKINILVQKAKEAVQNPSRNKESQSRVEQPSTPLSHDHHATCHNLTQLAAGMLTTLGPPKKSHSHILEGCLCAFLGHLAVFIDPQPPQKQETFAQLEAPYQDHILSNAMTFHKYLLDTH